MNQNKKNKLIAYALDFISFLLENNIIPEKAILFGSVVSEEFDKESDIDIFIDINEKEEKIQRLLTHFEKIKGENWRLKGIENQLSLKIGKLEKWPELKRSIQSYGILLYGNYKEVPENMNNYALFLLNFDKLKRAKKVSVWRKMYGYSQKVKSKTYSKAGIVKDLQGKKLERGVLAIPSKNIKKIKDFLNQNKVKFKLIEIWSDSIHQ